MAAAPAVSLIVKCTADGASIECVEALSQAQPSSVRRAQRSLVARFWSEAGDGAGDGDRQRPVGSARADQCY